MIIQIIYEDDDILVINKPAGITVNTAETTKNEITIQDWAEDKLGIKKYTLPSLTTSELKIKEDKKDNESFITKNNEEISWDPIEEFYKRGGVVHRLDKETSGILILAKNPQAFTNVQNQFKERTVKKTYIALSHGNLTPQEGEISVPVGRLPWNRNRFGILPGGRESKTNYKVLQYYHNAKNKEKLTLIELYPQSGRTHQIRVHLKYIGYPIFSDFLYAGRKTSRNDRKILPRVFLHAAKISFTHPVTNKKLSFDLPLPQELTDVIAKFTQL